MEILGIILIILLFNWIKTSIGSSNGNTPNSNSTTYSTSNPIKDDPEILRPDTEDFDPTDLI